MLSLLYVYEEILFCIFDKECIIWSRVSVKVYNLIQSKTSVCYYLLYIEN